MRNLFFGIPFLLIVLLPLHAQYSESDVTALYAIKTSCGTNGNLNWSADVDEGTWTGVAWNSATPKRVTGLNINNLSLSNTLTVGGLSELTSFQCSGNLFTEVNLTDLISLNYFNCVNNLITDLNFTGLADVHEINCSGNKLTELDMTQIGGKVAILRCDSNELRTWNISNVNSAVSCTKNHLPLSQLILLGAEYSINPQEPVFESTVCSTDTTMDYSSEILPIDAGTVFTFYKNDVVVATNYTGLYTTTGTGVYHCVMTCSHFAGLAITTEPIIIGVIFNEVDMDVLQTIDAECDKNNKLNWDETGNPYNWDGVTWNDPVESLKRVSALDIKSKSLTGNLDVTTLEQLHSLDCSGNQLSGLDVSDLSTLTSLKCSGNPLPLSSLATGLNVTNFEFELVDTIFEPRIDYGFHELDYSSEALVNGVPTLFKFYRNGVEVASNTTGKFTPTETGVYTCVMTNTELNGVVLTTAAVTVNEPANLETPDLTKVLFYPNPARTHIWFSDSQSILEASLYSLNGALLMQSGLIQEGLDISQLESGVYLIRIRKDNLTQVQKMIIY